MDEYGVHVLEVDCLDRHEMPDNKKGRSRNAEWFHMLNKDVISMPDKWEYPW
jgi:hypothetical protein